jgi:hypothetical protein
MTGGLPCGCNPQQFPSPWFVSREPCFSRSVRGDLCPAVNWRGETALGAVMTFAHLRRYLQLNPITKTMGILVIILTVLAACTFIYLIEKRKRIREKRRRENNKGKFQYMLQILKED